MSLFNYENKDKLRSITQRGSLEVLQILWQLDDVVF